MEVTIVIPVHNRAEIVGRTLASVAAQTYRPLKVVLVDNNSTDRTASVLAEWQASNNAYDFVVTVVSESQPGATVARNRGLQEVDTPLVMFFDSDDTMSPGHVAAAVAAMHWPEMPDIVGWDVKIHRLDGSVITKPFEINNTLWHCVMHGCMGTQRYITRTELIRKVGGWNPDIPGWNDIELGTRLLLTNPKVMKLKGEAPVDIYATAVSITGVNFGAGRGKWEKSLDAIERSMPTPRLKRYARLRRALLAGDYAREGHKEDSDKLLRQAVDEEQYYLYQLLYQFARAYVGHGWRGAARILRPFF